MITVLIADDEALVRDGMRAILEIESDIDVIGEAQNGEEAVRFTTELQPDVVLIDIRMPVMDGLEATRRILSNPTDSKIIVLTTFDRNEYVYEAMKAGASAFLLQDVRRSQLTNAIRGVLPADPFPNCYSFSSAATILSS